MDRVNNYVTIQIVRKDYGGVIQGRYGGKTEEVKVRRDVWSENLQNLVSDSATGRDGSRQRGLKGRQ